MAHADQKLVKRLLKGDQQSFDAFFSSYFPRLFRFALTRTDGDEAFAEEIVQSALCKAMQKLDTYKGKAALFTWLCTFCRYELSNHRRKHGRTQLVPEFREDDPGIRAALESLSLSAAHDPDAACYRDEVGRLVQVTLDHLPSIYSDALEWKYVHGLSVKEIAERLQRGSKATESILTRARQAFKEGFVALSQDTTFSANGT